MMNADTGNELITTPIITRDDITATRKLEPIYDSQQSFYGKATLDTDKFGGQILKSYDTPIMAIYKGMPFSVESAYENNRQGVKILDTLPEVGQYSQTTSRHTKEFLRQFTDIGTDLSTKAWNKALAERTTERSMDVYGLKKAETGYELSVAIDDRYGESLTFPINPELISPTPKAAAVVLHEALVHLREHDNPYNRVLALQYQQNIDHILQEFSDRFERCINRTAENDPNIKALVEHNQQREQSQENEYSAYQQRIMEKINREMNQSDDRDQSQDMDR